MTARPIVACPAAWPARAPFLVSLAVPFVVALAGPTAPAAFAAAPLAKKTAAAAEVRSPGGRDPWQQARSLADQGRHAAAIAILDSVLRLRPDDTGLLWLRAAITGEAGRNADAVVQYEQLLAAYPELGIDLRRDLVTERIRAGDFAGAIRDCDEMLNRDPGDDQTRALRALALSHAGRLRESLATYDRILLAHPGDPETLRDRARVLAWMGKHGEAAAVYREVLSREPDDRAARLGLAQNENWMGRHRRAAVMLEPLANGPDADPEAIKTLAFARYWSGDAIAAREALRRYLALAPDDPEARDLDRRLRRESAAWVQLAYGRADDSDGLRIGTTTMDLHVPIGPRTMGTVGWGRDNVRDAGGTRDPLTLWAGLEHTWSATWAARASLRHVDLGDSAGTAGMGDASVTWRPADGLRVDAGVSREVVMTRLALREGISVLSWAGGVDWTPLPRIVLHAGGALRDYSDDNRAERAALWGMAQVFSERHGEIRAGVAAEQLNTRLDLDHGYYDPDYHIEWGPQVEADWWPARQWTISGRGQTGWQRDKGAEAQSFFNVEGTVEWEVTDGWTLAVGGSRSNSNLETASGYKRKSWRVAITRGF